MRFELVHEIGNRVRWRTANTMTIASAAYIADEIAAIEGIEGVKVSSRTGSVIATVASLKTKKALADYLASLEKNPVILRRPKGDAPVSVACADMPVEARRALSLFERVGRILTRAVRTMPVIKVAKHPMQIQGREPEGDDARLDFTPVVRWVAVRPLMPIVVNCFNAILGAIPYVVDGFKALLKGRLTVEVLDAAAITVSLLRRDWRTAGIVILLLGLGEMLERYTRK